MKRLVLSFILFSVLLMPNFCAFADLQNTGGVLQYFDENGRPASEIGIDVSYYNNQIDWQALKDQGFDFAVVGHFSIPF